MELEKGRGEVREAIRARFKEEGKRKTTFN